MEHEEARRSVWADSQRCGVTEQDVTWAGGC